MPCDTEVSFDALYGIMMQLGLTSSEKDLVHLSTQAICLGIMTDTVAGTATVPGEKLSVKEL